MGATEPFIGGPELEFGEFRLLLDEVYRTE
jgi:hypothetical protein